MAKPFRRHLGVDAGVEQVGCMGVSQIVEADAGETFQLREPNPLVRDHFLWPGGKASLDDSLKANGSAAPRRSILGRVLAPYE